MGDQRRLIKDFGGATDREGDGSALHASGELLAVFEDLDDFAFEQNRYYWAVIVGEISEAHRPPPGADSQVAKADVQPEVVFISD